MTNNPIFLGVNIDHVATVRQARAGRNPSVLAAAHAAIKGGADAITVHLREDRRHIQDADVLAIKAEIPVRLNFEMAASDEMLAFALALKPSDCCLVPERRAELTTEGGLDVAGQVDRLKVVVARLTDAGIRVSMFIDPNIEQIDATIAIGAPVIELHTGEYSHTHDAAAQAHELARLADAVTYAANRGLQVNAGHGLDYQNVMAVAAMSAIHELNIGHSIVSRAIFVGLRQAVAEMAGLMQQARLAVIP